MAKDKDQLKLSKATVKKINKVATGPLLGPVEGKVPASNGKPVTTVAPLGTFQSIQERLEAARTAE
jgi:hypothetical protein